MPSLIVSSRYTTDSQLLREAAQRLGWETLRLDGDRVPDWFEPPDERIALFYTAPHAFEIAAQLSRTLVGCDAAWTTRLPAELLRRELWQTTLAEALALPGRQFVKHAISKAFPAAVYDAAALAEATVNVPRSAAVHVGEPVDWTIEYRCFVRHGRVAAISPYRRHGAIIEHHVDDLGAPPAEVEAARQFATTVLESAAVAYPPAFVLDVGVIAERGWAVVEFNECWASGLYTCDPAAVLETLIAACIPTAAMTTDERRWDFQHHYHAACSKHDA